MSKKRANKSKSRKDRLVKKSLWDNLVRGVAVASLGVLPFINATNAQVMHNIGGQMEQRAEVMNDILRYISVKNGDNDAITISGPEDPYKIGGVGTMDEKVEWLKKKFDDTNGFASHMAIVHFIEDNIDTIKSDEARAIVLEFAKANLSWAREYVENQFALDDYYSALYSAYDEWVEASNESQNPNLGLEDMRNKDEAEAAAYKKLEDLMNFQDGDDGRALILRSVEVVIGKLDEIQSKINETWADAFVLAKDAAKLIGSDRMDSAELEDLDEGFLHANWERASDTYANILGIVFDPRIWSSQGG